MCQFNNYDFLEFSSPHIGNTMNRNTQINRETFLENLRDALKNLYNFEYLRSSPLTEVFGIHTRFDSSRTLQKILVESINAFKPSPDEPDQSRAWRIFDSLFCCYVQQLKQQIVADQLCISPRQLRREQRIALESLADYLWDQYNLDSLSISATKNLTDLENSEVVKELGWVQDFQHSNPANLNQELDLVLEVTEHLRLKKSVIFERNIPDQLPPLALHPVALSQILVNVLNAAINRALPGAISINVKESDWLVEVDIQASEIDQAFPFTPVDQSPNLSIAKQLAALSSIQLSITNDDQDAFKVVLQLPIQEQVPVLLVDDNRDALDLFQRYTVGSRYRLVTTQDPNEILDLVSQNTPKLIVLDIMMPENNGWKILGMLKNHPLTIDTPIIVCTILPQRDLALSLGASDFISKPINREAFLSSLNQQSFLTIG